MYIFIYIHIYAPFSSFTAEHISNYQHIAYEGCLKYSHEITKCFFLLELHIIICRSAELFQSKLSALSIYDCP